MQPDPVVSDGREFVDPLGEGGREVEVQGEGHGDDVSEGVEDTGGVE